MPSFSWNYHMKIGERSWVFCQTHAMEAIAEAHRLRSSYELGRMVDKRCAICKDRVTWGMVFDA